MCSSDLMLARLPPLNLASPPSSIPSTSHLLPWDIELLRPELKPVLTISSFSVVPPKLNQGDDDCLPARGER